MILQTKSPDLPVIIQVVEHNYKALYNSILEERKVFHYPPFYRVVYVFLRHREESVVDSAAIMMGALLRQWFGSRILGPDKPAVARVKTLCIRKIVVKLENGIDLARVRQYLKLAHEKIMQDKRYAALQLYFDVDPL